MYTDKQVPMVSVFVPSQYDDEKVIELTQEKQELERRIQDLTSQIERRNQDLEGNFYQLAHSNVNLESELHYREHLDRVLAENEQSLAQLNLLHTYHYEISRRLFTLCPQAMVL